MSFPVRVGLSPQSRRVDRPPNKLFFHPCREDQHSNYFAITHIIQFPFNAINRISRCELNIWPWYLKWLKEEDKLENIAEWEEVTATRTHKKVCKTCRLIQLVRFDIQPIQCSNTLLLLLLSLECSTFNIGRPSLCLAYIFFLLSLCLQCAGSINITTCGESNFPGFTTITEDSNRNYCHTDNITRLEWTRENKSSENFTENCMLLTG